MTVHDVIEQDGQLWIVMALVEAESLADLLADHGPLAPRRVAEIGLADSGRCKQLTRRVSPERN